MPDNDIIYPVTGLAYFLIKIGEVINVGGLACTLIGAKGTPGNG
jgi:hypothetical protein